MPPPTTGAETGAQLGLPWLSLPNPFPVVPMDGDTFSPTDEAAGLWSQDTTGYFANGSAGNYIFSFVNQVAADLHAMPGQAGDELSTLAYMDYAVPPTTVTLDPSVEVQFCFGPQSDAL